MRSISGRELSYFTTGEKDLESVEEQGDQDDNCFHCSSDGNEVDHEADSDLEFESSELDTSERSKVEAFVRKTCECSLGNNGKPCSSTIRLVEIIDCRNNCAELNSTELNLVILGMIQSAIKLQQGQ